MSHLNRHIALNILVGVRGQVLGLMLLGWVLYLVVGCVVPTRSVTTPTVTPPFPPPSVTPTAVPDLNTKPTPSIEASVGSTLTLWVPAEMMVVSSGGRVPGALLTGASTQLRQRHPDLEVQVVPKPTYGPGGISQALRATRPVVPWRLPDIVAVDAVELPQLVAEGLIISLDDLVPATVWEDLYPFALQAVTVEGRRYAVPFQEDIVFLAYNSGIIEAPPTSWADLIDLGASYVFPLSGDQQAVLDGFLVHYLALGGELEPTNPQLDVQVAVQVLENYQAALDAGAIPDTVRSLRTLEDCWSVYLAGDVAMSNVSSVLFERDRQRLTRTRYAPIPTATGQPATVAHVWAWAIVNKERLQTEPVIDYLAALIEPENQRQWLASTYHLPARKTAIRQLGEGEYQEFLNSLLLHSYSFPRAAADPRVAEAIVNAVEDVFNGVATPRRAALDAAAVIGVVR